MHTYEGHVTFVVRGQDGISIRRDQLDNQLKYAIKIHVQDHYSQYPDIITGDISFDDLVNQIDNIKFRTESTHRDRWFRETFSKIPNKQIEIGNLTYTIRFNDTMWVRLDTPNVEPNIESNIEPNIVVQGGSYRFTKKQKRKSRKSRKNRKSRKSRR